MSERTDAELIAESRAGRREAFAVLVDRHKDSLVGYLARLSGCRERAQDLAQETFLRLYQSLDRYREEGHLQALLYRIATNLLRSEERRARRWSLLQPVLRSTNGFHAEPTAPAKVLREEASSHLEEAVAALPLRFRVPLVLREIEGWPYAEIAGQLGVSEGTVKSRVHRGRERLRQHLEPYWNGGAS
jgi:RNA polymerase sigma-70 factor (ECF subfamily)